MLGRFEQFSNAISAIQHAIQKIERVEMARYGLKGPHAHCLLMIAQHPGGVTATKLCELCEKDKAAISRAVTELESAGMIFRQDREGKRYRSLLFLTEKGTEVAKKVNHLLYLAVHQASEGYSVENRETFIRVLNLVAANLQSIAREGLQEEE